MSIESTSPTGEVEFRTRNRHAAFDTPRQALHRPAGVSASSPTPSTSRRRWTRSTGVGNGWQNIKQADRKTYLKNAYRVLLTRARQGMVIAVPHGDPEDPTRKAEFYDGTFE
jgi:hypothetical protein